MGTGPGCGRAGRLGNKPANGFSLATSETHPTLVRGGSAPPLRSPFPGPENGPKRRTQNNTLDCSVCCFARCFWGRKTAPERGTRFSGIFGRRPEAKCRTAWGLFRATGRPSGAKSCSPLNRPHTSRPNRAKKKTQQKERRDESRRQRSGDTEREDRRETRDIDERAERRQKNREKRSEKGDQGEGRNREDRRKKSEERRGREDRSEREKNEKRERRDRTERQKGRKRREKRKNKSDRRSSRQWVRNQALRVPFTRSFPQSRKRHNIELGPHASPLGCHRACSPCRAGPPGWARARAGALGPVRPSARPGPAPGPARARAKQ